MRIRGDTKRGQCSVTDTEFPKPDVASSTLHKGAGKFIASLNSLFSGIVQPNLGDFSPFGLNPVLALGFCIIVP